MLTVTGIRRNKDDDGNEWVSLILESDLTMVKSKNGTYYASKKKTSVYSTLDEDAAKQLIGSRIEGDIVKESCNPYTYETDDGREIEMNYKWVFCEKPKQSTQPELFEEMVLDDGIEVTD